MDRTSFEKLQTEYTRRVVGNRKQSWDYYPHDETVEITTLKEMVGDLIEEVRALRTQMGLE